MFIVVCVSRVTHACIYQNGPTVVLNKKSVTYVPICIIVGDKNLLVTQVKFDVLTRVVMKNSFAQVTAPDACANNKLWFGSEGCAWDASGTYGLGPGKGAPTNFYANVMGVPSMYRKRYAYISGQNISAVFPIVTLVIQVDGGVVKQVFWDDDCYFNEGGEPIPSTYTMLNCRFNAYDLATNSGNGTFQRFLNPSGTTVSTIGYDCSLTVNACRSGLSPDQKVLPAGFCDLAIYVVWTGTSADGQQLASAGQRFRRFRAYAMANQYLTVSLQMCSHEMGQGLTNLFALNSYADAEFNRE